MDLQTKVERLQGELSMTAPDGTTIVLESPSLELDLSARAPQDLRLLFVVSHEDWERIDRGAWFGLDPKRRGPCFGGGFRTDQPIEITTRLPRAKLSLLATPKGERKIISELIQSSPTEHTLRQTETWQAIKVLQGRGRLKTGLRVKDL